MGPAAARDLYGEYRLLLRQQGAGAATWWGEVRTLPQMCVLALFVFFLPLLSSPATSS